MSKDKPMKRKNFETLLYSSAGVVVMFVVLLAFYVVTSALKLRIDVTGDKANTLSPGTKKIISKIGSRVTIRFYCTQADNAMPPVLRTYAQHIEDMLGEYKQAAQGKIIIQKLDPKPDSDAEDSARLNGIEGQATGPFGSDKIYLGIVVSIFDEKFALPWLPPERERLLEYDISRAIARVVNGTPPVIGIMSAFPVFGVPSNPMTMSRDEQGKEAWAFVTELKKDFIVRKVPMTTAKIDDEIKALVVVHPRGITDSAQYAIDQFILRGGKLLAFLDPHAFFDESHDQQNQAFQVIGPNAYGQSSLDKLLKAWGLDMDINKVVADTTFGSRNPKTGETRPTILLITRAGIDETDAVTSQIDNLVFPFGGAFTGKPADGLKQTVLIKSSPNSELVDSLISTAASEQILRDFKADNVAYALAVHLTGKFKTAFPNGNPDGKDASQLKESTGSGEVVLVADSDMLNDKVCVKVQNVMGHRIIHPLNGNLNFVQSVVELFSGDDDLISARSRASTSRPFTRLKDMEASAGKQWEQKIQVLETKQREMERMITELQTHKEGGEEEKLILSPEQQAELENYQQTRVQVGKDLKQVRSNLRQDTDALEFWTKVVNIGAVPVLVAVTGLVLAVLKYNRKRRAAK
jgi:ABC-type uncharacterized transport system involved in gliding motility auxiliary subunit